MLLPVYQLRIHYGNLVRLTALNFELLTLCIFETSKIFFALALYFEISIAQVNPGSFAGVGTDNKSCNLETQVNIHRLWLNVLFAKFIYQILSLKLIWDVSDQLFQLCS